MIGTPTPPPAPLPLDAMMSRSWALLKRNPAIAAPPLSALIPVLIAFVLLAITVVTIIVHSRRHGEPPAVAPLVIGYLAMLLLAIVFAVFGYAAMYGMANAAWERGHATFADGIAAARAAFWPLVVAFIGIFGLAIGALILALPTLGISFIALALFTMYVLPAVVVGRRGGFAAIGESFRLVRNFFGTSIVAALVLLAIQYGISLLSYPLILPVQFAFMASSRNGNSLPVIPIPLVVMGAIGYVIVIVALFFYQAFYALAIVGLYRSLVDRLGREAMIDAVPVVAPSSSSR